MDKALGEKTEDNEVALAAVKAFEVGAELHQNCRYVQALPNYQRAHDIVPNWYLPIYHAAVCLHHLRRYTEAIACYRQALRRKSDLPMLRYHYAKALKDAGQLEAAMSAYRQALMLDPENPEILYSQGLLHLLRGDWLEGWPGYELRGEGSDRASSEIRPATGLPRWQGGGISVEGGIIVYAEQGMGDAIQCFRYAQSLRNVFDNILFSVHAPLVNLFRLNSPAGVTVVPRVASPINEAGCTHYAAMMSLPALFGTTPETVPTSPYLGCEQDRINRWRNRFGADSRPRVGLVWQGGKLSYAPARDMALEYLSPLLARKDIVWVSLQKDISPLAGAPLIDWMHEVGDFRETAELVSTLDLVIAVDTAVAHLAGAMGKPVWLLNRFESEWRWMHGKAATPWYPSMRIFTQPAPGDWHSVIAGVESALDDDGIIRKKRAAYWFAQGKTAIEHRDGKGAESNLRHVLHLYPDSAQAYFALGLALEAQGRGQEGVAAYQSAVATQPEYSRAWNNLGLALCALQQLEQARAALRRALEIRPDWAEAYNNLGVLEMAAGCDAAAERALMRAVELDNQYANAWHNLGQLWLMQGKWELGWPAYEWRYHAKRRAVDGIATPQFPFPMWQGEPLTGKVLLLWVEQGLGDHLMCLRYVEQLVQQGAIVMVFAPPPLMRLLRTLPWTVTLLAEGETLQAGQIDFWVLPMSLPYRLRTTVENVPAPIPYLSAEQRLAKEWAEKLDQQSERFRIGLVWAGNHRHLHDKERSLPFENVATLLTEDHVQWVSLQTGERRMELEGVALATSVLDAGRCFSDFADTAACMANLDLLITVDTAAAHLAGAMGIPVWLLNRYESEWRWMRGVETTPWYPSMRIFNQPRPGDWQSVICTVAKQIKRRIEQPSNFTAE